MHEVSLMHNIFRIVREKMEELYGKPVPVRKIRVVIGKMANVVPAALDFAFELLSKNTEFEGANLEVEYIPLSIRCQNCKEEMELDEPFMFCRKCDSLSVEVVTGRELYVDSFEIDEKELTEYKEEKNEEKNGNKSW